MRFHVEQREPGSKKPAWRHLGDDFYHGQDYDLFSLLAGVRGRRDPLVAPRGFPRDAAPETRRAFRSCEDAQPLTDAQRAAGIRAPQYFAKITWGLPLAEQCRTFYQLLQQRLAKLGDPKLVRCVCWFVD